MTKDVPRAGELYKETGGTVSDAAEESTQKTSKKCSTYLETMFLVSSLRAVSVGWICGV